MANTIAEAPVSESPQSPSKGSLAARVMRGSGWAFIWLGLLTLGFFVHQIYVTTWFAQQEQGALEDERLAYFEQAQVQAIMVDERGDPIIDEETGQPVMVPVPDPTTSTSAPSSGSTSSTDPGSGGDGGPVVTAPTSQDRGLPLLVEAPPHNGASFASITISSQERLKDGWNVVEGVKLRQLQRGAGHMPWTPLPGQPGNSVISGHRTTHGAPFHDFDDLVPGDRIEIETALGIHVYEVRKTMVVKPSALWVTAQDGPARAGIDGGDRGAWLTLTTCHPKFSARKRLIVFAELVDGPNFATISRLTS